MTTYIANTPKLQMKGLQDVKKLPADSGMLFIYEKESPLQFWMINTYIPLSIGFFNKEKVLIDIQDMAVELNQSNPMKLKIYHSKGPAKYALEVPQGWFKKHDIRLGDKLSQCTQKT